MDPEQRWLVVRRLLHDDTVALEDRVAGSLVLLYAQPLSRIATMTTDQVHGHNDTVLVRLGRYELTAPEPLAGLLASLVASGRGHHVGIGGHRPRNGCSRVCFLDNPSPRAASVNDSAHTEWTPGQPEVLHSFNSPLKSRPRFSPTCSASP